MRQSLATRLAGLYAFLLGITVLLVILASSIALVYELAGFTRDIVYAKHEEARFLAQQLNEQGITFKQAAPQIASALSGIGLRVAVYDAKGHFLGGDITLRPHYLDRVLQGKEILRPANGRAEGPTAPAPASSTAGRSRVVGEHEPEHSTQLLRVGLSSTSPRGDPLSVTAVMGGFVAFAPDDRLILTNLIPYWRVIVTIAIVAIALSWFIGRVFARQALAPLNEVTDSLQALAGGDYTQRRFISAGGGEIAALTGAYNDAAASVAASMVERHGIEERMRQFVADAGHELRTPLTVIAGYIDVLRRGAIEEPTVARQILATMALEKEHMRGLIDRLMRLARLDSEAPAHAEAIDVNELLNSQVVAAKRLDDAREIDSSTEGVSEIHADRGELGEALWNVVENALKYAPGAKIHLRAFKDGGKTVLSVRDDGPGMTESERVHAFERFYRGEARGEIGGTGLGLAIAKRAVHRAGGTIAIDSAPGHGTTVTIRLG